MRLKKLFVARAVGVKIAGMTEKVAGTRPALGNADARISQLRWRRVPTIHETVSARPSPATRLLGGYLHPDVDAACHRCLGCISFAGELISASAESPWGCLGYQGHADRNLGESVSYSTHPIMMKHERFHIQPREA